MNIKIVIYDIETLYEYGLFGFYFPVENQWKVFNFNSEACDLFPFLKFAEEIRAQGYYLVGYNSLRFDAQVMEYVLRNGENWYDKTGLEISKRIWRKAQDIIHDQNYDLFPPYREEDLTHKHIDLLKIHHFDNVNRRTSLKWLEFMMDMENIEEMPHSHCQWGNDNGYKYPIARNWGPKEHGEILEYWKNDIYATHQFYLYSIGEVSHEEYRGKNMVGDRLSLIEEFNLSPRFMNFSDVKIGDELNKIGYCKITNLTPKDLYEMKKKRGRTPNFTFGDCIPEYVSFKTPRLQEFLGRVRSVRVNLGKKEDSPTFEITIGNTKYTIAQGGIHSNETCRIIECAPGKILRDGDIGSQYPNGIRKRRLFPSHLGEPWLVNYDNTIRMRLDKYKPLSQQDTLEGRRAKGVEGMLKLALNGGGFGKTNERENWQYDPQVTFFCTIGNQFEILMLIEDLELSGIEVISANTDGILCYFDEDKEPLYKEICKRWEKLVGNDEIGKLEYTDFSAIYQESVNCYIAVKTNGKVKIKGRIGYESPLNKNNTKDLGRIERKAIVDYFTKKIPVEETIRGCDNIFMFCHGSKVSRDYHYETIDLTNGDQETYKQVIRYFYSRNGKRLIKVKNEDSTATGPKVTQVGGENRVTIFNRAYKVPMNEYNIDYEYYINNALEFVRQLERGVKKSKARALKVNPNQAKIEF